MRTREGIRVSAELFQKPPLSFLHHGLEPEVERSAVVGPLVQDAPLETFEVKEDTRPPLMDFQTLKDMNVAIDVAKLDSKDPLDAIISHILCHSRILCHFYAYGTDTHR